MSMQNGARLAGCAGGENDIAGAIGITHDRPGRGKILKCLQLLGLQCQPVKPRQAMVWVTDHGFGLGFAQQHLHLAVR